jgi:DNA-directed RNA polymerase subunit M/transcription elongation factor TFIIS
MGAIKIRCPKCGWILGDTNKSVDCVLNCPKCNAVKVKMKVATFAEYNDLIKKEEHE